MNLLAILSFIVFQTNVSGWQTYKTLPQVDIMYKMEQCHDEVNGMHREYAILKFVNKTNNKLKLTWNLERYEGTSCSTCGKDEYNYSLELNPNETIEGNCVTQDRLTTVFVKHLDLPNHTTFTKFELGNLTVTQL